MTDAAVNAPDMETAKQAVDFMAEYGLAPTPENYRVWAAYVAGSHRMLCAAVEDQKAKGASIDAALSDVLYETFFKLKHAEDAAMVGDDTQASLARLQERIDEGAAARRDYANALAASQSELTSATDRGAMAAAVDKLLQANREIERRSAELEAGLQETVAEMQQLTEQFTELQSEALTDGLTGLANRKHFDEALAARVIEAHETRQSLVLIMCDIDHFKKFNDTWGHQTGDQIIRFVSSVLSTEADDIYTVARYGGEEFAIIIPDASLGEAGSYAERVRERVASRTLTRRSTKQSMGRVTISLGVATLMPGEEGAGLIERADKSLYRSKRTGRNKVTQDGFG